MGIEDQEIDVNAFDTKLKKLKKLNEIYEFNSKNKDYCEVYEFDKIGDKENFNKKFNKPELRPYLFKDRTKDFFQDIDRQIELISNDVIMIFGPKGMGKSEVLQKIIKYWKRKFKEIKGIEVNKHSLINYIGFSDSQMTSIARIMDRGDICGRDEDPNESGRGSKIDTGNFQNIINQTRELQTSFIFTHPEILKISGVDYFLEVAGKYRDTRTTRCVWYDRRGEILGMVNIELHEDDEFREAYGAKKKLNMENLLIYGGGSYSHYNKKKFIEDLIKLYEFCEECGANRFADVKTHLTNYNLQIDPKKEPDKLIVGSIDYTNDVIRNVVNALKGNLRGNPLKEYIENQEESGEDDSSNIVTKDSRPGFELDFRGFTLSLDKVFKTIKKEENWHNPEKDIQIFKLAEAGQTQAQIGKIFKLDRSSISGVIKKVRGKVNYYKGKYFEDIVYKKLLKSKLFDKVEKKGGSGVSDIFAYNNKENLLYIYSIKTLKIDESPYSLEKSELNPEIKDALLCAIDYETHLILLCHDNFHNQTIQIEYNYKNPTNLELSQYINF